MCATNSSTASVSGNFPYAFTHVDSAVVSVWSSNSAGSGLDGCYIMCSNTTWTVTHDYTSNSNSLNHSYEVIGTW